MEEKTETPSPSTPPDGGAGAALPEVAAVLLRRGSLRFKVVGLTALSATAVALIMALAFTRQSKGVLRHEMEARGRSVALELASNLAFSVNSADKAALQQAASTAVRDLPDLAYLVVRAERGEVLGRAFAEELAGADPGLLPPPASLPKSAEVAELTLVGRQVLAVVAPVYLEVRAQAAPGASPFASPEPVEAKDKKAAERKLVGLVQLGIDLVPAESELSTMTVKAGLGGLAALLLCILAAYLMVRRLTGPLEKLSLAAAGLAAGDLRQQVQAEGDDEIEQLAQSFSTLTGGLRAMLIDLKIAAQEMEKEAANILSTSTQQSAMASEQASAINETSTTVSEIAQTSKQATEHADSVIKIAQKSEDLSRDGQRVVEEAMSGLEKLHEQVRAIAQSITDLSERTMQIGDIISTVKDLAEQSNLLALNASIEAAKAGEHGRGFAVVAMEMRNLAEQSKFAAGEVRTILSEVQKGTRVAVAATDEGSKRAQSSITMAQSAGGSILGLAEVIRDSSLAARQIANNTRQQTIGVEQIVSAIAELSSAMSDTLEGTRRIESVATNLTTLSKRLTNLVGRYQL